MVADICGMLFRWRMANGILLLLRYNEQWYAWFAYLIFDKNKELSEKTEVDTTDFEELLNDESSFVQYGAKDAINRLKDE